MMDIGPYMNGVLRLLIAGGTPFLFTVSILSGQTNLVMAAESPIEVESRAVSGRTIYGLDDDEAVSGAGEMIPFLQPIEENAADSPDVLPAEMAGIEGQYQLQLIQREVMELRGLVEELNFQVERMRVTQEDRYLELDKRFQTLSQEMADTGTTTNVLQGDTEPGSSRQQTPSPGQNERALYETALELIRNRQYDLAIAQLQAVIEQYPDGVYAPNAYYWLGEVYAAKPEPEYDKARQALAQVISFFPDHRKVPDAAFKLGKVYNLMGDCARATDILNQVVKEHKGKSVAKLAESYLRDKVNCQG